MLAVLPVTLAGGEQTHELVIDADRARGPLEVDVQAVPHEAIAANNVVSFQVMVRQEKLRVIYMEGSGDPEYRYLHDALEEDPTSHASRWAWTICTPRIPRCIASPKAGADIP